MKNVLNKMAGLFGLVVLVAAMIPTPALAQWDAFGGMRTVLIAKPLSYVFSGTWPVTNAPVDVRPFEGVGKIDIYVCTNQVGLTLTATLEQSDDTTNWVAGPQFAISSQTVLQYTNTYYGTTNLVGTNTWLLPGTNTTVSTPATLGWATSYLVSAPMTNTGAVTVSSNAVVSLGFNITDARRYLHLIWTSSGTATNFTAGATLTGRTHYVP